MKNIQFERYKKIALEKGCPKCKGKVEYRGYNRFVCIGICGGNFKLPSNIYRPKDMSDSRNWSATCEECGGKMDYYNLRYCCRKCGHILEV